MRYQQRHSTGINHQIIKHALKSEHHSDVVESSFCSKESSCGRLFISGLIVLSTGVPLVSCRLAVPSGVSLERERLTGLTLVKLSLCSLRDMVTEVPDGKSSGDPVFAVLFMGDNGSSGHKVVFSPSFVACTELTKKTRLVKVSGASVLPSPDEVRYTSLLREVNKQFEGATLGNARRTPC